MKIDHLTVRGGFLAVLLTGMAWGQTAAPGAPGGAVLLPGDGAPKTALAVTQSVASGGVPAGAEPPIQSAAGPALAAGGQAAVKEDQNGLEQQTGGNLSEAPLEEILKTVVDSSRARAIEPQGGMTRYWRPRYHPQVTRQVFDLIHYPYYPGGRSFSVRPPDPNEYDGGRELVQVLTGQPAAEPNLPDPGLAPPIQPIQAAAAYERCMDMVYQWRSLNESRDNALEIVRSIELTRTQTKIYQSQPKLAIGVKRTLGQIGLINIHFDQTSRTVVQMLMAGQDPRAVTARLDKQLADLASQYDRLSLQNDQISIAMGMGPIDRGQVAGNEPIQFINISALENGAF